MSNEWNRQLTFETGEARMEPQFIGLVVANGFGNDTSESEDFWGDCPIWCLLGHYVQVKVKWKRGEWVKVICFNHYQTSTDRQIFRCQRNKRPWMVHSSRRRRRWGNFWSSCPPWMSRRSRNRHCTKRSHPNRSKQ